MPLTLATLGVVALLAGTGAPAQTGEDPAHAELRTLRDELVDAVNKRDMPRLLQRLHPDVVVTWQNGEVSRRPDGVREYLTRMLEGANSIVEGFATAVTVDELTILHGGDTGVSFGSSRDRFALRGGQTFDLNSRWSATVVRRDGRWVIASFHASANLFDNPLLNGAKRLAVYAGVGALIAGLIVGLVIGRRRARR
ncbi:MAG TPA: nuclear transport factor 2 family protein [Vicinamibacterales bacterium]|nr:nuclear transport factor 2 family protein [Vicinamibacterales bacterium]